MLKIITFCLLLLPCIARAGSFSLPANEKPVTILSLPKSELLVTEQHVYLIGSKGLSLVLSPGSTIKDAVLSHNQLVLATDGGLKIYDSKHFTAIPNRFPQGRVLSVATDRQDRLWIATPINGCFLQNTKDSFTLVMNIPGVYTLRATPDSNIWVGTNVGMYRINSNTMSVTRYAEEGYSGYELPDNLVEHIFTDELSNIWVIMPEHVSFKRSDNYTGEIPSYDFVGAKNNNIHHIAPFSKGSYFFVTQQGCLLLPSSSLREEHRHNDEVFAADNTHAYALSNQQLGSPAALANEQVLYATQKGKKLYLVTAKGGWTCAIKHLWK